MPGFSSWPRRLARLFTAAAWVIAGGMLLGQPRPAAAQVGSDRYASIVIDAGSGTVLSAVNADELRYPASLTKMMTLYMLFEAMRDRRVSLDQLVPVSPWAASMSPTKLGLTPGRRLGELLWALAEARALGDVQTPEEARKWLLNRSEAQAEEASAAAEVSR